MTILDRPPNEWKRKGWDSKCRLQVLINQQGRCKCTGERLGSIEDVRFDHRPALWERRFDTDAWDTIPAENDPAHVEAITKEEHDRRTFGTAATTAGSDLHRKAKGIRLEKKRGTPAVSLKPDHHDDARGRKTKWPTRPFQKRTFPSVDARREEG